MSWQSEASPVDALQLSAPASAAVSVQSEASPVDAVQPSGTKVPIQFVAQTQRPSSLHSPCSPQLTVAHGSTAEMSKPMSSPSAESDGATYAHPALVQSVPPGSLTSAASQTD